MFFAREEFKSQDQEADGEESGQQDGPAPLPEGLPENLQNSELLQMLADGDREALAQSMEQAAREVRGDEYSLRHATRFDGPANFRPDGIA